MPRGKKESLSVLKITLSRGARMLKSFWSKFVDLIASTDHVKKKSIEFLAAKDPEVGAFLRRYGLTSVVAKLRTCRKCFKRL